MKAITRIVLALMAALCWITAGEALAGTVTGNSIVTLNLVGACTISSANYSVTTAAGSQQQGSWIVTLNCTNTDPWVLSVNGGLNPSGTSQRNAVFNGNQLPYNLYSDSGYSQIINNTGGTVNTGTGTGSNQTVTVYTLIPSASASLPIGTYTDTLTFTVTF